MTNKSGKDQSHNLSKLDADDVRCYYFMKNCFHKEAEFIFLNFNFLYFQKENEGVFGHFAVTGQNINTASNVDIYQMKHLTGSYIFLKNYYWALTKTFLLIILKCEIDLTFLLIISNCEIDLIITNFLQ